jgi:hypothetical protein
MIGNQGRIREVGLKMQEDRCRQSFHQLGITQLRKTQPPSAIKEVFYRTSFQLIYFITSLKDRTNITHAKKSPSTKRQDHKEKPEQTGF